MSLSTLAPVDLRAAFRSATSSVWVVTGSSPDGPVGFTAISITSVSIDPPMVSFNIAKASSSLATIRRSRRAALHLLSDEQGSLARRFARDRSLRFVDDGVWSAEDGGLPRLHDVATRLVADVLDLVDAGDSFVAVARVTSAETSDRRPLTHHAGGYHPSTTSTNGA